MNCTSFQKVGIPDFKDLYSICNCGEHVKSDRIDKMMTIRVDAGGKVKEVNLSTVGGGIKKKFKIHELMARTFMAGYEPTEHNIIHIDGDVGNNSRDNLRIQDREKPVVLDCDFTDVAVPDNPTLSDLYQVCRCGEHVVSKKTGKVLAQRTTTQGYKEVTLNYGDNKENKKVSVHQLVAHAFLKYPNDGQAYVVDHINRNRQDNRLANLRFATYSANNKNSTGSKTKKPIIQMDMHGNFISEYDSITQALEQNKEYGSAPICVCLKKDIMAASAYGYRWKYKNESDQNISYVPVEGEVFKTVEGIKYYNSFLKKWEILEYPNYSVSNFGNVLNIKRNCIVGFNDGNHMSVNMMHEKKKKAIKIHVLVAYMFIGLPSEDYYTVKFKDGNLKNCRVDNLEWVKFRDMCIDSGGRSVVAIGPDGVETVFKSVSLAVDFLTKTYDMDNNSYTSGICACLSGYQESAYGYKWKEYVEVN